MSRSRRHEPCRVAVLALAALLSAACAPVPRPQALDQVEAAVKGPVAAEARVLAPSATLRADKLVREAEAAFDRGDIASAQILAEQALGALAHAHALARVARAQSAARSADEAEARASDELAKIDADQARIGAEADALEQRLRVTRDAQPVVPSGPADAAREKARLEAARALALQARLLCGAARLLRGSAAAPEGTPPPSSLAAEIDAATLAVDALDKDLDKSPAVAPIDRASRVRAGCLSALTAVRRAATPVARAPGAGDALLSELSAASLAPSRDDRGVVVTLRGALGPRGLSADGDKQLAELGRVAAAHPGFPVLVVVHRGAAKADDKLEREQGDAALRALKGGGAKVVEAVLAGGAAPVVDRAGRDGGRNARLEVVFVTPEAF